MMKVRNSRLAIATIAFACGLAAFAMPTKDELVQAQKLLDDLTADDVRALNAGTKKPGEVAAAQMALAGEAETEAGKYLLLQGAFKLYARSADYDAAADALARMRKEIADLPPEVVVELVNGEMRRVAADKAPKVLAIFRDAQRTIKCRKELAAAETAAKARPGDKATQRRLAECHAGLGDWAKALEVFAQIGDEAAKYELDPSSAKGYDALKAANYWWEYSAKDDEPFKVHAAVLYRKGLADGSISGLRKSLAEKRLKQMESVMSAADKATPDASSGTGEAQKPAAPAPAVNGKEISVKLATGVTLDFVPCPAGTFEMGKPDDDDKESPTFKHKVTITRPFWIGKYQVTRGAWAQFSKEARTHDIEKSRFGGNNAAMVDVSFYEVLQFCGWMNRRYKASLPKGCVFRLPTEAEWEYALNAGGNPESLYIKWRDGDKSVESQIMVTFNDFKKIADENNTVITKPYRLPPMTVGTKAPNDWGIYDMLSNGREFVLDTVNNLRWTGGHGMYYNDYLGGKGILLYKESETDPFRFVLNSSCPLIRGDLSCKGSWYMKSRGRPDRKDDMFTTFRLVIGPDLLKERGIKFR